MDVGNFTVTGSTTIQTQGGDLTIEAANFTPATGFQSVDVITNGGNITINSRNGQIPSNLFLAANSSSASAAGGKITIEALDDVSLVGRFFNVDSSGPSGGGAVAITSRNGLVDLGTVTSASTDGAAGSVTITAAGNVSTGALNSKGFSRGGDISLTSASGGVTTDIGTDGPPLNPINSSSTNGAGGKITVKAASDVSTGNLTSSGVSGGGDISLTSANGEISTNFIDSSSTKGAGGTGGSITIRGANDVSTAALTSSGDSKGGDISLTSANGNVSILFDTGGTAVGGTAIDSHSTNGAGGNVTLQAANGNMSILFDTGGNALGGTAIDSHSTNGAGGNVTLQAANGNMSILFDTGGNALGGTAIDSSSANGASGNVTLEAFTSLAVGGGINARGMPSGGTITLQGNEINLGGGPDSVIAPGGNLTLQPATPGQDIAWAAPNNSNPATLDLTTDDLNAIADGFSSITLGGSNGTGTITVPANTIFDTPITLQSPGGAIVLGPTIQAPALTASGATITSGDITTTGNQSYTGAVTLNGSYNTGGGNFAVNGSAALGSDTTITTIGGAILLNGPVNATLNSQSPETLALNAATGNIALQGAVGNSLALGALTASGANISLQDVTTIGNQSYTGPVTLGGSYNTGSGNFTVAGSGSAALLRSDTTITTNGGNIQINRAVNATHQSGSPETLTLDAGTGNIALQGTVGAPFPLPPTPPQTALGSLSMTANDIVLFNSLATNQGNVTITGNTSLRFDLGINTYGGDIRINGPVNATGLSGSPETLTLNAGTGNIELQGNVGDSLALGFLKATGTNMSLHNVSTVPFVFNGRTLETGEQTYTGSVTFNSAYSTGGGNFTVTGNTILGDATTITTLNSTPGAAPDGKITFNGTIDGAQALSLQAGTGNVVFGADVGVQNRLGSTSVLGATDITIGGRFVAGDVNFVYTGFLNSPQGSLDVTSLSVASNARGASVFGTVAGASGRDAAPVVKGVSADPDFTINGCVMGLPCFSTVLLPPPAQPRSTPPEVVAGDPAAFEPLNFPPVVVTRPPEDTALDDPSTTQFSNFGNEELWTGKGK